MEGDAEEAEQSAPRPAVVPPADLEVAVDCIEWHTMSMLRIFEDGTSLRGVLAPGEDQTTS
eukprot:3529570-Amphidinium_carterae.1